MSKKIILSTVLATSLLLVSCGGRDDDVTVINNQGGGTTIPEPPNNSTPTPPSPQNPVLKPSDFDIAKRMTVSWKADKDIYLKDIDIADLINNKEILTIDFLKKYVSFVSSDKSGTPYYLTDEDIKLVKIDHKDINYSNDNITLYTYYNGIKSEKMTLPFSAREFYERKITLDKAYISQNYMRGIYERGGFGIGNIFNYDKNRLDIDVTNKSFNNHSNDFDYTLKITDKEINKEFSINKNVEGFKTLAQLAESMQITPKHELLEAVKTKIGSLRDKSKTDLTDYLKGSFITRKWIQNAEIEVDGNILVWIEDRGKDILQTDGYQLGIYLENPHFVLNNAKLEGNDLHMTIELQYANDITINKQYKLIVKGVK